MLKLSIDKRKIQELKKELGDQAKRLPNDVAIAVNATAKKTKTEMSKAVRQHVAVTAKGVNRTLSIRRANKSDLTATVTLKETVRPSLKEYGARQTKAGVSYRIKKGGGRGTVRGAFIVDSLGGHAYKRRGKRRLPISKLHGPSPWAVFKKQRLRTPTIQHSRRELIKQLDRRIQFRRFKRTGR